MSNRLIRSAAALALMTFVAGTAGAQTQTVTFAVNAVNQIAVTGSPSLTITTAVAGSNPTSVSDATTAKWAVTTNTTGAKVTASLDLDMPTGLTLSANLTAPSVGTSAGAQALSSSAVDVVTGMTKVTGSNLGITYTLDATTAAGVVGTSTRTVTYTVISGS